MIFVTGPDTRTSLHVQHLTGARAGLTLLASLRDASTRGEGFPEVARGGFRGRPPDQRDSPLPLSFLGVYSALPEE